MYLFGGLGTKIVEGDNKSPEGFYTIGPKQLNPVSNYHLAMNVGYPNKLERLKGYTGNSVMIHGNCMSAGCYAMTDAGIDEIYTLVYNALKAGQQTVQVDIFPFRMNSEHMKKYTSSRSIPFWKTIKPGYDFFERNHVPAVVGVRGREYVFN
ncbi:L,D-transpeptidase family protein [Mucilaginibacter sp.]|uniref:L,D-transpeptidase family protein n=1 Tax=Mucilaginibacter sp. TaxID=1882438 RepID=UPI0025EA06CC|nr:L,D-transpeptidase family protein [Mucilaginibacter sp.]